VQDCATSDANVGYKLIEVLVVVATHRQSTGSNFSIFFKFPCVDCDKRSAQTSGANSVTNCYFSLSASAAVGADCRSSRVHARARAKDIFSTVINNRSLNPVSRIASELTSRVSAATPIS
jgi:hypothetical protein